MPDPIPAPQTIFFAEMRKCAGYPREAAALANADFVVEPVNLAISWADAA